MTNTAEWLAGQGIGGPVAWQDVGLLARRQTAEDERREERAEAERKAQLEEAHDARQLAYYMGGVQPGAVLQRSLALAEVDGEIAEHQAVIDKLERRRARIRQEGAEEAEAVSRSAAMAQRSAAVSPSGLGDAAEQVAAVQRELAARQRTDAVLARARSRQPRRVSYRSALPKAPGEPCGCGVPGCTAYPIETDRPAARRDWSDIEGREITRYGGPVSIR